ncbi:MAG TPA: hypothetical protein VF746_25975 [Longimicrobium sp.]|jgi:hypothetical protein
MDNHAKPDGSENGTAGREGEAAPKAAVFTGQVTTAQDPGGVRPICAGLSRRLAAAADGHRNGQEIFFVARYEADETGDFELDGPYFRDQLGKLRVPDGFGIFGPYCTADCDDDISRTPIKSITIELRDGRRHTFEGDQFDALFWSVSALEKFVIPHYTVVRGVRKAQQILREFVDTDVFLLGHDPNTEETMFKIGRGEDEQALQAAPV